MKNGFAFHSVIAGLAALSISGGASAQDEPAKDGAYIRLGVGATFLGEREREFAYPGVVFALTPPNEDVTDYGTGKTFAAALGFDYADGIRTELEYRYASSPEDTLTQVGGLFDGIVSEVDGEMKAHLLMTNFFFDFANSSPLTPFVGGGVGGAFVTNQFDERDAALALQGRAGVSLEMGTGFSADFEYIYLRTNDLEFSDRIDFVVADDRYQASSVMVSLRRRF
ncbi:outer membrane protein [Marinicaulis aureus]|uniref:Outer membrane protein n=1 Tax=Hyphococcus aureus TaxID=2666033 RepID=A0ABW1KUF2_9PROT